MKKIQLPILLVLILVIITACGAPEVGSIADMSGYEGLTDKDTQVFIVSDVKDFLRRMDEGETFAAYFGFTDCPWCNDAIDVLNEEAIAAGAEIYYINTRPNRRVKANSGIPDYDLLVERVGAFLRENEDGVPYLYVPNVFFVKDGGVVKAHEGTIEGYLPDVMEFPPEYEEELREVYKEGFDLLR